MQTEENPSNDLVATSVRFGISAFLIYAALRITAPFLDLIVWGIILAVGLGPAHLWLARRLGASAGKAAFILTAVAVLFVLIPSFLLGNALGETAYHFAGELRNGSVELPAPPASVQDWPVVGGAVYKTWLQASNDLGDLLARSSDRVVALGGHLLRAAGGALVAILQFAGSLIVAGVLLARRERSVAFARDFFARAAPQAGARMMRLSEQTVRSVAAGVLGVAIIQATLVGVGLLVAGVPFAGVWSLLCLLLGIMQLPMGLIVIPLIVFEFMQASTMEAVLFLAYMAPVMLIDNVLKPLFMGRGVEAPMIVIFIGALGGFAARGFIGLFTGAIVLVLTYELFFLWLQGVPDAEDMPASAES